MSKTIKRLLVVLVGVLFATSVYAQSTTASIAGHVTDCVYTVGHRLSCLL